MDAATMVAINNLNMLTVMSAMQQTQNFMEVHQNLRQLWNMILVRKKITVIKD